MMKIGMLELWSVVGSLMTVVIALGVAYYKKDASHTREKLDKLETKVDSNHETASSIMAQLKENETQLTKLVIAHEGDIKKNKEEIDRLRR